MFSITHEQSKRSNHVKSTTNFIAVMVHALLYAGVIPSLLIAYGEQQSLQLCTDTQTSLQLMQQTCVKIRQCN